MLINGKVLWKSATCACVDGNVVMVDQLGSCRHKAMIQWYNEDKLEPTWTDSKLLGQTTSPTCLSPNSMLLVICRRSWWSSPGIYSCPSPRTQRNQKRMRRRVNLVELPFWLLSHASNVSHQISHNVSERPGSWGPVQTSWGFWLMLYLCLSSNWVYSCVTILANITLEKREDLWYHYPRGAALHSVISFNPFYTGDS